MHESVLIREQILAKLRSHADTLRQQGVTEVALFGSVARGDATSSSDIDVLIDTADTLSLFELGAIQVDLEELLGRRVDLVTRSGIDPRIREQVFQEAIRAA